MLLWKPDAKIGVEGWDVPNAGAGIWGPSIGGAKTLTDVLDNDELNVLAVLDVFVPKTEPKTPLADDEEVASPEKWKTSKPSYKAKYTSMFMWRVQRMLCC